MNITAAITNENIIFDRYLGSTLVLPYSGFDSIKLQPNDSATTPVINLALRKLYENFLYLYKSSRVASNIIPVSSTAIAGVSSGSTAFRWYTDNEGLSSSQFITLSSAILYNQTFNSPALTAVLSNQDNITNIAAVYNRNTNAFTMFTTCNTDIVAYNSDKRFFTNTLDNSKTINIVLSSNELYVGSGINWQQINDFAFGASNAMYVLDTSANRVVKYDATGFLTDETVLSNTLPYVDSMGGYGDYSDNSFFNSPQSIDVYGSQLYVLDSGNGCVKQFDEDLNWVTTHRLFRDFLSAYPVHLSHDINGNMFVLTDKNKILRYDSNFQNKIEIKLDTLSANEETFKKVIFSPSDTNIYYILTDKNIYKYLVTQPDEQVGKYLPYLFRYNTNETYVDFVSLSSDNGDYNIVFSRNGNAGKFNVWYDNLNLFDVLAVKDFDIYDFLDIRVSSNEYLQNWVFNKMISKLLINHMRLRDQIIGKFIAKRDTENNVTFRGTRYFLPDELKDIAFEQDMTFYIGMNEIFQNTIVNRCLEKIYNIQLNLYKALQADIITSYDIAGETLYIN
jgi:hypothetical protein